MVAVIMQYVRLSAVCLKFVLEVTIVGRQFNGMQLLLLSF